jgi:hypothetical protein
VNATIIETAVFAVNALNAFELVVCTRLDHRASKGAVEISPCAIGRTERWRYTWYWMHKQTIRSARVAMTMSAIEWLECASGDLCTVFLASTGISRVVLDGREPALGGSLRDVDKPERQVD